MKFLVCGASGQLGSELRALESLSADTFMFTDVDTLDISDTHAVSQAIAGNAVNVVINCAAYTDVNRAENDRQLARKINAEGVASLAAAVAKHDKALIHISTDYVFDGTKRTPYLESDPTVPLGVYGATKLEGEQAFATSGARGVIIRTSWLYSTYGNNFVKTMLRLGAERESLGVVDDQHGTPTYAADLARAIVNIAPMIGERRAQIYHYSNLGQTTWARFAERIMELAALPCRIERLTTEQYPTPTERPKYSVLSKDKIMSDFHLSIPDWDTSLEECIKKLCR